MSDLMPCPFCASARVRTDYIRDGRQARCLNCFAYGPAMFNAGKGGAETDARAIAAWNRRADQWMPIESAPRDGTHILLGRKGEPVCEGFYDDWSDGQWACAFTPTHWRPLPAPPEAK